MLCLMALVAERLQIGVSIVQFIPIAMMHEHGRDRSPSRQVTFT